MEKEDIEKEITEIEGQEEVSDEAKKESQGETEQSEPEFEIGKDKDGKPIKAKLSEINEWKQGYLRQQDYTRKTQELAEQRKELEELIRFADYLRANPQKLQKVLAVLEEKTEEMKEDISSELAGLDETDPYAKLLKRTFESVSRLEKKIADLESKSVASEEEMAVEEARKILVNTLEESAKAMQFDDEEEKNTWRQMVLSYLKDNPRDYKDEEDFKQTINEVGKKYYDALQKIGETKIKKYLESKKGKVTPATTTSGGILKKKPTIENLQETIEDMLAEEEKSK